MCARFFRHIHNQKLIKIEYQRQFACCFFNLKFLKKRPIWFLSCFLIQEQKDECWFWRNINHRWLSLNVVSCICEYGNFEKNSYDSQRLVYGLVTCSSIYLLRHQPSNLWLPIFQVSSELLAKFLAKLIESRWRM